MSSVENYIHWSLSQIPDHAAEHDELTSNPNVRCPGWRFIQLAIDPSKVRES